jgi:hypothetical protein
MDMIKKFFPFSFNVKGMDINSLVVSIIIYVVAGFLLGLVFGLVGTILSVIKLGFLMGILGTVVGIYCFAGIVLAVLKFFDVLK